MPAPHVSACFVAALTGTTSHAVEEHARRLRKKDLGLQQHPEVALDAVLDRHLSVVCASLPTPLVRGIASELASNMPAPPSLATAALIEAGLLHHCGTPLDEAAAALLVSRSELAKHVNDVEDTARELRVCVKWRDERAPLVSSHAAHSAEAAAALIQRYAHWIAGDVRVISGASSSLRSTLDFRGSTLSVRSMRQLEGLAPLMKALTTIGFVVSFKLGADAPRVGLEHVVDAALRAGAVRDSRNVEEQCLARLRFLGASSLPEHKTGEQWAPRSASLRTYGRVGHLAVAGFVTSLHLHSLRSTP